MQLRRDEVLDLQYPLMQSFSREQVLAIDADGGPTQLKLALHNYVRGSLTYRLHLDSYFTLTIGVQGKVVRGQVLCSCQSTFADDRSALICSSQKCGKTVAAKYQGSKFYHYDSGPPMATWLDSLCCSTAMNSLEATLMAADADDLIASLNERFGRLTSRA